MKALFSLNELHTTTKPGKAGNRDTDPVRPELLIIKSGTAFFAKDQAEEDFFLKEKAARLATKEESALLERVLEAEEAAAKKSAKTEAKTPAKAPAKAADAGGTKAADAGATNAGGSDDDTGGMV